MRSSDAAMVAARANPNLVSRDFIRVAGRNRDTDAIEYANFWSGIGVVTAPVLDLDTGSELEFDFVGSGSLIDIGPIVYICEQTITVRTQSITLSQLTAEVVAQVRGYDLHEQPCNVYQGDFDPVTRALVAPAESVWSGFIDEVSITEPEAGQAGAITISVRSHQSEMTRVSPAKRSHASEVIRNADDNFYIDTDVVASWENRWGALSRDQRATIDAGLPPMMRGKNWQVTGPA